jgi:hypothetical protein
MHKMFLLFIPLFLSLLSLDGRAEDVANIYSERHVALLDVSDVELGESSSELKKNEQLDYLDDDRRLFIPTFSYLSPQPVLVFASKKSFSQASIRAPPAKLI